LPSFTEASNISLHEILTNLAELHARIQNASRRLDVFGKNKGSSFKIMTEAMLFVCLFTYLLEVFTFALQKKYMMFLLEYHFIFRLSYTKN